jgi:hypothetical protein
MLEVPTSSAPNGAVLSGKHGNMRTESLQSELARLQKEQAKTREDEVFGGLSPAERSAYDCKQARIEELEHHLYGSDPNHQQNLLSSWDAADQDSDDQDYDLERKA